MKDILVLVVSLTLISAIAGLCLAVVSDMTAEEIRKADLGKIRESVEAVLPPFVNTPDDETNWITSGDYRFFIARNEAGEIIGLAFMAVSTQGYGGTVETMVGIDTEGVIQNIRNVKHLETPGLGTKIKEEWFVAMYRGASLDNRTFFVKKDDKGTVDKPSFDSITGATISSRAVTNSIREVLEYYAVHKNEILPVEKSVPAATSENVVIAEENADETGEKR